MLFVLAGVNGAGKSSIGGHLLARSGLNWFNPDAFARDLVAATGCDPIEANAQAWHEGLRRLDEALAQGRTHAFETTLGGDTIAARIKAATQTHDVLVWYCGLASPEQHIARVKARVAAGGHHIPQAKIRERFGTSMANLIALLPLLAHLRAYDNSLEAPPGSMVPDPALVAEVTAGSLTWPTTLASLQLTPEWAKALVEAALQCEDSPHAGPVKTRSRA